MTNEQVDQAIKDRARLMVSLTNITPDELEVEKIEKLRELAKTFGSCIVLDIQGSRERSLAITKLEECVMWAVKAILLEDTPAMVTPDKGVIGQQAT